jgi:hypothetical protein
MAGRTGIGLSATRRRMSFLIRAAASHGARSLAGPSLAKILDVRFLRHRGIYRSDVGVPTSSHLGRCGASRWSAPGCAAGRGFHPAPSSSSAMSSGRLFLDRVARQQSPSPLHRQEQNNKHPRRFGGKEDISTLPARGHFYFALTLNSSA